MRTTPTRIPDVKVLVPCRHQDARGWLAETFRAEALAEIGIERPFVQENHSCSAAAGTVRGLHFQVGPGAHDKLVRVVKGAILDVAVDLRRGSPTFGGHAAVELAADDASQVLVPAGFAHGFCTLLPDTEVLYRMTGYYAPQHERGLLWNDPALGIVWPVSAGGAILSDRDRGHPRLADLADLFD